ncbi:MAG: hypothetical protein HY865_00940 [Chloroflexi bacterium]|nr:hypothetical protein [Chloroflexota bacterium]
MKKVFLFVVMTFMVIVIPTTCASASQVEFSGPAELQYYDAQIDILIPRLENFQAQYHAVNGRYYQALQSHAAAPDVPTVPDGIDQSPTDQPEDLALFWEAFAELPDVLAWAFSIDTYSGPDGDGYVLNITTIVNGETWNRCRNFGPASEDWRNSDWYQVVVEEF